MNLPGIFVNINIYNFDFHGGILPTKSLIPDGIGFKKCWFKEEEKIFWPKTYQKSLIHCLINSASIS